MFSGCQFLSFSTTQNGDTSSDTIINPGKIQKVYIQSFTGQNIEQFRTVFFETVQEQNLFILLELLPDDYSGLKILRLEVTDYSLWDHKERLELGIDRGQHSTEEADQVLRRNAIVRFVVSLFEAETGKLLLRKPYSQPFQQVYAGNNEIKNVPEKSLELRRLTKVLVLKLLSDFYQVKYEPLTVELEEGYGRDWISINIFNLGDSRLKKGNRFAQVGEYEQAIWMWQLVLYKANKAEPLDIYRKNRASAYYNLGVVYYKLGDWLKAAEMYSMANRMEQKLKYAQAWGDTMQNWLETQQGEGDHVNEFAKPLETKTDFKKATKSSNLKVSSTPVSDAEMLKSLERNQQLLLNARELWPLEPSLKYIDQPTESIEPGQKLEEEAPGKDESMTPELFEKSRNDDELIKQIPVSN